MHSYRAVNKVFTPFLKGDNLMTGEPDKQESTPFDTLHETLSLGGRGVDVSGVQAGGGHTGITITPSLSMPKKPVAKPEEKLPKTNPA